MGNTHQDQFVKSLDNHLGHEDCLTDNLVSTNIVQQRLKEATKKSAFATQSENCLDIPKRSTWNESSNSFEETIILVSRSHYKWRCISKVRKFAVKIGDKCEACEFSDFVPCKKEIYLEPRCGHEMHHECNIA